MMISVVFTFMWPCIVTNFFVIKPTRCTNLSNLFRHEILHVSGISSAHHQEFIHCTLSNGICHTGLKTAFEQDQDGTSWSCSKARVSCRSRCGRLVRLVGFIIKKILFLSLSSSSIFSANSIFATLALKSTIA